jgi:hypothetical protein
LDQAAGRAAAGAPVNRKSTALGAADVDPDGYFTFSTKTRLVLGHGEWADLAPVVSFKPISDGFEGFILQRNRDGSLNRNQNYHFEIHNDVGWDAAAERYADAFRAVLSIDPFAAEGERAAIGFHLSRAR